MEILQKQFMANFKKNFPLAFNMYIYATREVYKVKPFFFLRNKITIENRLLMNDIIDFFEVGHVTPSAIYKSTAIYIYELFRDTSIKKEELNNYIENLFIYSFGLDKYTNFKNFEIENYYIKNIIADFIVLDTNNEKKIQQLKEFNSILFNLTLKNSILFKLKFLRKIIIKPFVNIHISTVEKALYKHFGKNPTIIFFMDFISVSNSK